MTFDDLTPSHLDVSAVHFDARLALLTDNTLVPIVALYDDDGEETDDPDEAYTGVAGHETVGWFTLEFEEFSKVIHS